MARPDIQSSFKRCEATGDFVDAFYSIFLGTSDEVSSMFSETDFAKQHKLLRATVFMMVTRDISEPKAAEAIERIGHSHSISQLDIRPELYELWLDSLCATVKQLDPDWSDELELAWREEMRPGISLITSFYDE